MIRITDPNQTRIFTREEIKEVFPTLKKITQQSIRKSHELLLFYGELSERDPERFFLERKLALIVQSWSSKIKKLGAFPCELWVVKMKTPKGWVKWKPDFSIKIDQVS